MNAINCTKIEILNYCFLKKKKTCALIFIVILWTELLTAQFSEIKQHIVCIFPNDKNQKKNYIWNL